jgi:hypothetical protein
MVSALPPFLALYRGTPKAKISTVTYSFSPSERLTSPETLTTALHRAVVEVFTLQQAGRLMGDVCNISNDFSEDVTAGVQVRVDERGAVTLDYPDEEVREAILQAAVAREATIGSTESVEEAPGVEGESAGPTNPIAIEEDLVTEKRASTNKDSTAIDEELSQQISAWDSSWLSTPLRDQTLKFHVCPHLPLRNPIENPRLTRTSGRFSNALPT